MKCCSHKKHSTFRYCIRNWLNLQIYWILTSILPPRLPFKTHGHSTYPTSSCLLNCLPTKNTQKDGFLGFFLPAAMHVLWLKMALGAVKSVSRLAEEVEVWTTWQRFLDEFHKVFVNNFGSKGLNKFKFSKSAWNGCQPSQQDWTGARCYIIPMCVHACVQAYEDKCEIE